MSGISGLTAGIKYSSAEAIPTSFSLERSYETSEFYSGTKLYRLFMDSSVTVSMELEDTASSGLKNALGGSGILEQVQCVKVEETNNIIKVPRAPEQTIDDTRRMLKAESSAVRFLGQRITFTVSGKGTAVWGESSQATQPGSKVIKAAQGPYTLTFPAEGRIEQVSEGKTNDGNPDTWSGVLFHYSPNTGSSGTHLLTLPTIVKNLIPSNCVYVVQETDTMTQDLKTNVKRAFQVTCYLTN